MDISAERTTASFGRQFRLTKSGEFASVFNFRQRRKSPHLSLYFRPNKHTHPRLGLVVGRRVSKLAVRRNYMRRVLRELFRNHSRALQEADFILQVHKVFVNAQTVGDEFQNLVSPFLKPINL